MGGARGAVTCVTGGGSVGPRGGQVNLGNGREVTAES